MSDLRAEWPITLESPEETRSLGRELGRRISGPGLIAFFGDLGSGKTTLIQAIGAGLGVQDAILSPTYTIVNQYHDGRLPLVHIDCYRIGEPEDFFRTGLEEMLAEPALVCMEWSEHAGNFLPESRMELHLGYLDPLKRSARLRLFAGLWLDLDKWLDSQV
ncbi:MAG: tRNA (adenosine(37)-N6)-threonylcarbamoyltransferase complex ATPase subunit type 1 TsaE [Gemmatimonadota bacterium]|nr:tRNA (adenosine(37)-N6)-threonylcarbamoyltransferase complex ATPase subunit type 1 TsaE [Gemmatimonadota bacterium]